MADVDLYRDPLPGPALHAFLAARRAEGPVVPVTFGGMPALLTTRHDTVAETFRDNGRFPPALAYRVGSEPVVGRTFQSMDDADHRVYRRLATPAFRSRAVARLEATGLADLAHELLDGLHGTTEADLAATFTHRYPFIVIARLLGIPREAEDRFHHWALDMLGLRRDRAGALRAAAAFTDYLGPVLAERRRTPGEDVISELAHAEIEGRRFTDEEIFSHVRLLFAAGATTTHDALGSLLVALLGEGDGWARVAATPADRPAAIEELLRWETPVAILPRLSAPEPTSLAGTDIPPSTMVLLGIAAANRDPAAFPDPDRYDIDRDTTAMLSFGPGPRSCPGMHLARKEIAVALDVLLERHPRLRLADPAAAQPRGATVRGPTHLPVRLQ